MTGPVLALSNPAALALMNLAWQWGRGGWMLPRLDPLAHAREVVHHLDALARRVFEGLQFRTAAELSQVTTGTTVDRLHVIRLGYLLASLVAICCLYVVLSPKNPLVSFGRVILPWSRIGAPTRVSIDAGRPSPPGGPAAG